mmetsp:Transcript_17571/g.46165  ORF Transcript_17571/g.46165 Transcript_17571/m.46165 type:complete len:220 (-) Transcript_17571:156-815(-)
MTTPRWPKRSRRARTRSRPIANWRASSKLNLMAVRCAWRRRSGRPRPTRLGTRRSRGGSPRRTARAGPARRRRGSARRSRRTARRRRRRAGPSTTPVCSTSSRTSASPFGPGSRRTRRASTLARATRTRTRCPASLCITGLWSRGSASPTRRSNCVSTAPPRPTSTRSAATASTRSAARARHTVRASTSEPQATRPSRLVTARAVGKCSYSRFSSTSLA